ncbi:MAG: methyltransferase domain-containing protein [Desulfobulbaceae bacterium]|nr:methyltransferase domain-containing protein [Desulfobulbaceae bacterium]
MAEGLQFEESIRKAMEMAYLTDEIAALREEIVGTLKVQPGERVLDIGSGPGLLAKDLAHCTGATGSLRGLDMAENMLAAARKLCAEQSQVEFERGDAMSLPYQDLNFDVVVSTQVYEYVEDLNKAVAEFGRVLRLGGRGIIVDTDWSVPYWNAVDPGLRDRIVKSWSEHCSQEAVPMRLSTAIRSANLQIKNLRVIPLLNQEFNESTFSYWMTKIIGSFVLGRNGIEQSDIDHWIGGLQKLSHNGDYFFCINRYLFEVVK